MTKPSTMKLNTIPCDDAFSNIISYLDFKSAIRFTKMTHPTISNRIFTNDRKPTSSSPSSSFCSEMCFPSMWKEFYQRQLYAPPLSHSVPSSKEETLSNYYVDMIKYKKRLNDNLIRFSSKKESYKSSSTRRVTTGLPDSYYSFVPITPTSFTERYHGGQYNGRDDPPPVDFACTSFIFTSCNTSSEMAYLDPFNGSLSVFENIKDYAISKKSCSSSTSTSSSRSIRNNKMYNTETLIDVQNYFDLNIQEYFNVQIPLEAMTDINENNDSVVIDWLGIDSHTIVDVKNNKFEQIGNMICAARTIIVENPVQQQQQGHPFQHGNTTTTTSMQHRLINPFYNPNYNMRLFQENQNVNDDNELVVTEILAWKKNYVSYESNNLTTPMMTSKYVDNAYICRMDYSPYFIEICPSSNRVFASFTCDTPIQMNSSILITRACDGDHDTIMDTDLNLDFDDDIDNDVNDDEVDQDDSSEDKRIFVFPLLEKDNHDEGKEKFANGTYHQRKYFPDMLECIHCDYRISSFIVDPFGEHLIVGTERGTIELWNVESTDATAAAATANNSSTKSIQKGATRTQKINMSRELKSIATKATCELETDSMGFLVDTATSSLNAYISCDTTETKHEFCVDHTNDKVMINSTQHVDEQISMNTCQLEQKEENECPDLVDSNISLSAQTDCGDSHEDELGMLNDDDNYPLCSSSSHGPLSLPHCKANRGFNSIEIASHLPLHVGGFVGVQHHHNEGTTLSYWCYHSKENQFKLASLINLPLSPQPKPQVSFDGKRIVVFGQDHIGVIILVYKVNSQEDSQQNNHALKRRGGKRSYMREDSGGVINFTSPLRIEYSNRIRHCGLGGFEYYDFMFMSANERFIAVNTKTGNLVTSQSSHEIDRPTPCEGLFLIDLEGSCSQ